MENKLQREWVLERLKTGSILTPKDAYREFGIMRLGAIIHLLKRDLPADEEILNIQYDAEYPMNCRYSPSGSKPKRVFAEYILVKKNISKDLFGNIVK